MVIHVVRVVAFTCLRLYGKDHDVRAFAREVISIAFPMRASGANALWLAARAHGLLSTTAPPTLLHIYTVRCLAEFAIHNCRAMGDGCALSLGWLSKAAAVASLLTWSTRKAHHWVNVAGRMVDVA